MKPHNETLTTYEPDNTLKNGYILAFKQIYHELSENKWLMYQLFKRDLSAMHKQSLIGFLWIFIMPVVNVGVFIVLGRSGIFNFGDIDVPYPIYAILGLSFWQIFANGLQACSSSLMAVGDMVKRINFSKKSVVLSALGRGFISFLIQILLVTVLFIVLGFKPDKAALLIPLFAFPILFLTAGLGLILALLNSIVRDTGCLLYTSLSEYLSGKAQLNDVVFHVDIENLSFISCGAVPPNPAELLGSSKFKELLSNMRSQYEFVIIDTPPVIPVTDPVIVGTLVEGMVMVVQAGRTQRGIVKRAMELLEQGHINLVGHILTGIEYFVPQYIYRYL